MQFRDLQRQYNALKTDIDAAMQDVAASAAFIGGGHVKELEEELAEYVGVKHCISCANGTDALTIALKVWGIGKGDAVFVPDFTFFSSAETVAAEGATPVFVDVDVQTYNIDVNDLRKKIDAVKAEGKLNLKVIVAVDLFGLPANYPALRKIADEYGLLILEDGAQGFGGGMNDEMMNDEMMNLSLSKANHSINSSFKRACSFGDIATTSFFPAKPLGCYGDGGAVFTDNNEWAALAESLKVHGKGTFKYDNVRIGMNSRLDALQAAILQVKFKAFKDYELTAINKAAARYTELLNPMIDDAQCTMHNEVILASCIVNPQPHHALCIVNPQPIKALPVIPEGYYSSWAQYTIQLRSREERDALQAKLKVKGIPSMVYYPTGMHAQTAFAYIKDKYGPCPVSEILCDTVLSLPIHPYITEEEIQEVVNAIKQ